MKSKNVAIWAALVVLLAVGGTIVQASQTITILSQEYNVSGWAVAEGEEYVSPIPFPYDPPFPDLETWYESDSFSDQSYSANGASGFAEAEDPSGWVLADASSTSGTTFGASKTLLCIHPHLTSWAWSSHLFYDWGKGTAYADASAMLIFQPTETSLSATFSYNNHNQLTPTDPWELEVSLTDLTDGIQIYEKIMSGGGIDLFNFSESYIWGVNPSHVYNLQASASVNILDAGVPPWCISGYRDNCIELSVTLPPVPAPSAILLGSIGVGFVTWLRRRRTI